MLLAVLIASCTPDSESNAVSAGPPDELRLIDARASTADSESVWVAGGAYLDASHAGAWTANRRALRFSARGEVLEAREAQVPDGRFLFHNRIATVGGEAWLLGMTCGLPSGDVLGCGADAAPLLVNLTTGEQVDLALPAVKPAVGIGEIYPLGSVNGELIFARSESSGALPGTVGLGVYFVDVSGANGVRSVPLPPDVLMTPGSLCVAGGSIYIVRPSLDASAYIQAATLLSRSVEPDATWSSVMELPLGPGQVSSGGLFCSDDVVAVWSGSGEAVTVAAYSLPGLQALASLSLGPLSSIQTLAAGLSGGVSVLTVRDMDSLTDSFYAMALGEQEWRLVGGRSAADGAPGEGRAVGNAIIDISDLYNHFPISGERTSVAPSTVPASREGTP